MEVFGIKIGARIIGALLVIGLVVGLLVFGPAACRKYQSERAQARLGQEQGKAAVESGHDAINTAGNVSERQSEGETLGRNNERTIRDAPGSEVKAGGAATGAGISSLCRRPAYRDSERCRVRVAPAR